MSTQELVELRNKMTRVKLVIHKHGITDAETLWQQDSIGTSALEILEEICEIVGYAEADSEET